MSEPVNGAPAPSENATPNIPAARAERVLASFRPALGHDLPNLLVGLRGMLQMLESEQRDRLSNDGQDYLRRVVGATQRVQGLVHLLNNIARAGDDNGPAERVPLADLYREVTAVMKQLYPDRAVGYDLHIQVPVVVAPRRALHQALAQLLRMTLVAVPTARPQLELGSQQTAAGVELWLADGAVTAAGRPAAGEWETRLGFALVRELADTWGGTFRVTAEAGRGNVYTLLVPGS
jgi:signal transduction histidine kinase